MLIAVTSRSFSKSNKLRDELLLRYKGHDIRFNLTGKILSGVELVQFLERATHAIVGLESVDSQLLEACPKLEVISKYGVGIDNLDLQAFRQHRIKLGWKPGVNRRSVEELALCFALSLAHRVSETHLEVVATKWQPKVGTQLTGKIFGILGLGNVGKELVQLLNPFGCQILAHDLVYDLDWNKKNLVSSVSLNDLLSKSDFLSVHLPLDSSTRNMLHEGPLSLLKRDSFFINTSRGNIVDEDYIYELLKKEHLRGAAFDVFSVEPPLHSKLISHPRFLATPHIGGSTEESVLAMGRAAILGLEESKIP